MTSKLKCPFCKEEIISDVCCMFNKKNKDYTSGTQIYKCNKCGLFGNKELWQALIQAKRDLKIVRNALKDARIFADTHCIATAVKTIDKALEQIEHKE